MNLGIYATSYNSEKYIKNMINSLDNIKSVFENIILVVTDNYSKDNTVKYLEKYSNKNNVELKIIKEKSTRGKGRQIALEYLVEEYDPDILMYLDMDECFLEWSAIVFEKIIEHLNDHELYIPRLIGSKRCYKMLLKKVSWPNMN